MAHQPEKVLMKNIRALLTPTESRHTTRPLGGKSPSVKLMSRRENRELAKTNLKNMDRTMQELQPRSTEDTSIQGTKTLPLLPTP